MDEGNLTPEQLKLSKTIRDAVERIVAELIGRGASADQIREYLEKFEREISDELDKG